MNIETTNLNFHSTFKPQITYISKLLKLSAEEFIGDEKSISNVTGIPTGDSTGKVLPHLYYSKYMGLINFEKESGVYKLSLTNIGRVISDEDPYLLEDITKLLLHFNITDFKNGAPHWSFLFRVYNSNIDEELLYKNIEKAFQDYFNKSNANMTVARRSYTDDCFESLRLIEFIGNDKLKFNLSYSRIDYINLYSYTLVKSMEDYYKGVNEITIDQIVDNIKWNRVFGFDYETTLMVLDEIEASGYIKVNKQLNPITIIKLSRSNEILSDIYGFSM